MRKRRKGLAVLILFLSGCVARDTVDVPFYQYLREPPWVRVLIVGETEKIFLSAPAGSHVIGGSKTTLSKNSKSMAATAKDDAIWINAKNTNLGIITILPPHGSHIRVNDRIYAGEMTLVAAGDVISAVNNVDIENYVAGVVAGEMPLSWDDDALSAQAVAARSFALYEKQEWSGKRWFDLYGDERSQVYVGVTENDRGFRAASVTRGTILVWNWRIFPAFYHSTCGGHTRKAFPFLWAEDITPLTGVICSFCGDVDTAWRKTVSETNLRRALNIPDRIERIEVSDDRKVKIHHGGGVAVFTTDEVRSLVGPRILRNPAFRVRSSGSSWTFSGRGFGHGTGMCQHGANGMANQGYRWPSILTFYYPGAELIRVY